MQARPEWMTLPEVAAESRRTENAIRLLRSKKKGPRFRKVDGRLVVARADFDAWMSGELEDQSA